AFTATDAGSHWLLKWKGKLTPDDINPLLNLAGNNQSLRPGIIRLIRQILSGQTWHVDQLQKAAEAETDPFKKIGMAASASAEQIGLNITIEQAKQSIKPDNLGQISPTPLADNLENTTFTEKVWWQVTAADLAAILNDAYPGRLTVTGSTMTWHNLAGLNVTRLANRIKGALPQAYPVVQTFMQAWNNLIDKMAQVEFMQDYRPWQKDCPPALAEQFIVRGKLLHGRSPFRQAEQDELRQLFAANPNLASLNRLFTDLRDKQTLDNLYADWFSQEPISQVLDLSSLPDAFQYLTELVDFPEETIIRYHGLMTPEEGHALQSLCDNDADRTAVSNLYGRSLLKGLRGRELKIMARRGSAAPSAMRPLAGNTLDE
ncbi:MAG: hypothetical protein P8183_21510, partial [Anaerolineae bacterium]